MQKWIPAYPFLHHMTLKFWSLPKLFLPALILCQNLTALELCFSSTYVRRFSLMASLSRSSPVRFFLCFNRNRNRNPLQYMLRSEEPQLQPLRTGRKQSQIEKRPVATGCDWTELQPVFNRS